jgi:hypothetical protein
MKKATCLATGLLATVLMTGPALAGQSVNPSTTETTPAQKPSMLRMSHRVTGSVVAVDQTAQTFTVRDSNGKTYLLKADTDTAGQLSVLRQGERVKVTYKNSDGQMIATKITAA